MRGRVGSGGMAMLILEAWQCSSWRHGSAHVGGMAVSTWEAGQCRLRRHGSCGHWRHCNAYLGSQAVLMWKARQPSYLCEPNLPGCLDNRQLCVHIWKAWQCSHPDRSSSLSLTWVVDEYPKCPDLCC
ncbi:hypothetical protein EV426DRAFT_158133 [Tirmania nivea]|nr:hypothetical protein EV426DRAFT_158133 [Tirmania nivea]